MTGQVPAQDTARWAREMLTFHNGDWDSLHSFWVWLREGDGAQVVAMALVDPAIAPTDIPEKLARVAAHYPGRYACGFQFEAFVVDIQDMPERERAVARARRRNGTLHAHPDARECALAYVADADGHVRLARRFRDDADWPQEFSWAPGEEADGPGKMLRELVLTAQGAAG
jgi:hypothetical protein